MPIRRLAKVVLLAPAIGSALIALVGLLFGVALLLGRGPSASRPLAGVDPSARSSTLREPSQSSRAASSIPAALGNRTAPASTSSDVAQPLRHDTALRSSDPNREAAAERSEPVREPLFQKPVPTADLQFLHESAGQPVDDLVRKQSLQTLVDEVVPYVPFHFGLDMPLPHALEGLLCASLSPLELRDNRYAMLTGLRNPNTRSRAFLWVDTQQGIALGGIFFYPSNGEPTPTLTLFSKQVISSSLRMSELPPAFIADLSRWAAAEGLPPVTTRYFINASSEKTVLVHDEDFCTASVGDPTLRKDDCTQLNSEAKQVDLKAAEFLSQTHNATNATMRMVADVSQTNGRPSP